jgi:diguanylate cyclase (GGDEF)-like protein
LQLFS